MAGGDDEEENFTDPIFESELAEFKLRLAQTMEPVPSMAAASSNHQESA